MEKPKLSIVMPVKNRSQFLKEAINTITKQTFKDWELIIIDDHSKKNIKKTVAFFKNPKIKYYKLPKKIKGIANARNYGTKKAKSNIIVVADSDDLNYPNRLKKIYKYFKNNPNSDVFYSNIDIYYENKKIKKRRTFQPFVKELIYYINFIPHPASAYRKKSWEKVNGYNPKMIIAEDYNLWIKMAKKNMKFGYAKKALVLKKSHTGSIIKKHMAKQKKYIRLARGKNGFNPTTKDIPKFKKIVSPELFKISTSPKQINLWFDLV